LQVAVVHDSKIVLLGAHGLAHVEHSVPVINDTVFAVHSITKAFVGVAMMQLVEAGKVDNCASRGKAVEEGEPLDVVDSRFA
jgi:CubicO group peptidase (beta-lactamase class C family)